MDNEEQIELAKTSISPEALDKLADDEDKEVRWNVAYNKNTSSETLDKLANDENEYVCLAVAKHKNSSPETLAKLSNNELCSVFREVYKNPKTSKDTLLKIEKRKEICKKCKFNDSIYESPISCPYKFEHKILQ